MRVLFISNLFPSAEEPMRGLDNSRLLHHLRSRGDIRVFALQPTIFPVTKCPPRSVRPTEAGFQPQWLPGWYIPKVGSAINPWLMSWPLARHLAGLRQSYPFDVVLTSWLYPDACAVARLSRRQGFPFVAIAQGSDVHQYLRHPLRAWWIRRTVAASQGVITRSGDLARRLQAAGASAAKLHVIYNGIDEEFFAPMARDEARRQLGLPLATAVILFVGNLLPVKDPLLLIRAYAGVRKVLQPRASRLVMAGQGPLGAAVEAAARQAGFGEEVLLPGRQDRAAVAKWMRAADVLCISSVNEGLPNVLLEALAAGLPVVSTRVGGIAEVLRDDACGYLVEPGNAEALAASLARALNRTWDRKQITLHARQFSWEHAAEAYFQLLQKAVTVGG